MNISKINKNDYLIFAVFSSVWVFLGWIAYLSALGGFFYSWIFSGFLLLILIVVARQVRLKKMTFKISKEFLIAFSFILTFIVVSSFFVTPTIFSGRDQGSISEAAIRLSQNHKLEFSTPVSQEFFKIYGPGKALNFPGFYYTQKGELITQFPIAYISWLGVFYSFFGLAGLVVANAILLFIFAVSFYLLARLIMKTSYSAILLLLAATSFPIFWFFKFTLSENMMLAFLWLSILWAFLFIKEKKTFYFYSFLISAGFLAFIRIEGIFFLISGFLAIFFLTKKEIFWKKNKKLIIVYPAVFLIILFLLNFYKDIYFYKEIVKALLHFGDNGSAEPFSFQKLFSPALFEIKVFYLYGILNFVLLGILGIVYFWVKKKQELLIPLFIIIPSLIYLINPWISSDHPWMLRRFSFSIVPVFAFYSILFLEKWNEEEKKKYRIYSSIFVVASMLAFNLLIFSNYFSFSENKGMIESAKEISENFKDTDLVLVDGAASGDGWAMISGPINFLYNKNAVYFFNPKDLDKINRENFSGIYLISPEKNIAQYSSKIGNDKLSYIKDYSIKTARLFGSKEKTSLFFPVKLNSETSGKIFEIKK